VLPEIFNEQKRSIRLQPELQCLKSPELYFVSNPFTNFTETELTHCDRADTERCHQK
jgi:hypothetical protein